MQKKLHTLAFWEQVKRSWLCLAQHEEIIKLLMTQNPFYGAFVLENELQSVDENSLNLKA